MPTYEYQCRSCAQRFEARQSIMASPRTWCPHQGTPSWECPLERWHSPKGGGICVVAPETVGCCRRGVHWTDAPVVEG